MEYNEYNEDNEPLFDGPIDAKTFNQYFGDALMELQVFGTSVKLRLRAWNIELDSDDLAKHLASAKRTVLTLTEYYTENKNMFLYQKLVCVLDALNTWYEIYRKYSRNCDCFDCAVVNLEYATTRELIQELAAVEITPE